MGDDGTEDSGNVTGGEGDDELFALGAVSAWLGNDVSGIGSRISDGN
jgi:hypothetical protein